MLPEIVLNPPFCCGSIQQYGLMMKPVFIGRARDAEDVMAPTARLAAVPELALN